MDEILATIVESTRSVLRGRVRQCPLEELKRRVTTREPGRFADALRRPGSVNIIAEVKKASPSKGIIASVFEPARIARDYEAGGAAAISVLTEEKHFLGSLTDLAAVRAAVSIPILRKDFIVDEYQLYEAAIAGADAVLLIAAVLNAAAIAAFEKQAAALGLDCLVEVHTADELTAVVNAGCRLIGINNRNLKDFSVSLQTAADLARAVPADRTVVVESGIRGIDDIRWYSGQGIRAFLIGESLMKAPDRIRKLTELREI